MADEIDLMLALVVKERALGALESRLLGAPTGDWAEMKERARKLRAESAKLRREIGLPARTDLMFKSVATGDVEGLPRPTTEAIQVAIEKGRTARAAVQSVRSASLPPATHPKKDGSR